MKIIVCSVNSGCTCVRNFTCVFSVVVIMEGYLFCCFFIIIRELVVHHAYSMFIFRQHKSTSSFISFVMEKKYKKMCV